MQPPLVSTMSTSIQRSALKWDDRKLKFKQLLRDEAVKVFNQWDVMVKAKRQLP